MISDLTRERIRRFRSLQRAWWSLWILVVAFFLSLLSPFIANDKPLVMRFQGETYFPVLAFHSSQTFGGQYRTEADYKALRQEPSFQEAGGWMLMPPIPHSPLRTYLDLEGAPPHAPSTRHWLGTDSSARDVLARLIYGFRTSMVFALMLMAVTAFLGISLGGIQGYLGGNVDITVQRLIEIWASLPFLYVVILLGSIYGQSFLMLLVVTSIFGWIGLSYYMRAEFYRTKGQTYVTAARALGLGPLRIFFRQILPNALTPVVTVLPFTLIGGITALTSLDFLGFGLPPPTPSWGQMLDDGLQNRHAPWIALSACTALFATLLLATFIGEGAREAFDPKSEFKYE